MRRPILLAVVLAKAPGPSSGSGLLLEGDMAGDPTDFLLLEGDMADDASDFLLLEGDMA